MGGNQRIYLQEFDLYELLESISGKLNNREYNFWNNDKLSTNFTKTCCTCSQKFINGCPQRWLFGAGSRSLGISFEQTKRGLVWEVRNSVHSAKVETLRESCEGIFDSQQKLQCEIFENQRMYWIRILVSNWFLLGGKSMKAMMQSQHSSEKELKL